MKLYLVWKYPTNGPHSDGKRTRSVKKRKRPQGARPLKQKAPLTKNILINRFSIPSGVNGSYETIAAIDQRIRDEQPFIIIELHSNHGEAIVATK